MRLSLILGLIFVSLAVAIGCAGNTKLEIPQARIVAHTSNVDLFAKQVLRQLQEPSFAQNREFCGLIGYEDSGKLVATAPMAGKDDECNLPFFPDDLDIVASYHTHGAAEPLTDTEVPSEDDMLGDFADEVDGYVSTPGGKFWKIRFSKRDAILVCDMCMPQDPAHLRCANRVVKKRYTLALRRERDRTDLGICDQ